MLGYNHVWGYGGIDSQARRRRFRSAGQLPIPNSNSIIWGYGGIGRRAGFRFQSARVQVQLLLSPPKKETSFQSLFLLQSSLLAVASVMFLYAVLV